MKTPEIPAGHCLALEHADLCIGRVLEALKENGYYENSVIVITTNHGIPFPFSKSTLYDAGISVALSVRVPGSPHQGTFNEHLVSQVDMVPAVCVICWKSVSLRDVRVFPFPIILPPLKMRKQSEPIYLPR